MDGKAKCFLHGYKSQIIFLLEFEQNYTYIKGQELSSPFFLLSIKYLIGLKIVAAQQILLK